MITYYLSEINISYDLFAPLKSEHYHMKFVKCLGNVKTLIVEEQEWYPRKNNWWTIVAHLWLEQSRLCGNVNVSRALFLIREDVKVEDRNLIISFENADNVVKRFAERERIQQLRTF